MQCFYLVGLLPALGLKVSLNINYRFSFSPKHVLSSSTVALKPLSNENSVTSN